MNPAPPFASGVLLDPILPIPTIVVLGIAVVALNLRLGWRAGVSVGALRLAVLLMFRSAGMALVLLLLLQPSRRVLLRPPTQERVTLLALDTSRSMNQRDAGSESRFDAARNLLVESGAVGRNGLALDPTHRVFEFSDDARPVQKSVLDLTPTGTTTRFHKSIGTLLAAPAADEAVNAIILLTDGHDFDLANPAKTGALARRRPAPIFAVAFGKQGKVRDVSVRISGFQPYCYVKQKARINAVLRLVGCELEDLTVQLLREGRLVQTRRVNAGEAQELPVEFEVVEPEIGQYEYEVRVQPVEAESDTANNSALTCMNVIDQQIRVLVLEGDPYWDSSFLRRSLMENEKFDVDSVVRFGKDHVRAIRKAPGAGELTLPTTLDQLAAYDVVVLGRSVDSLVETQPRETSARPDSDWYGVLEQFVRDRGGTAIFSRGRAFDPGASATGLEPVRWGEPVRERVRVEVTPEGRGLSAFRALRDLEGGLDSLPDLLDERKAIETLPLTSTFAVAAGRDGGAPAPAVVHRRYGRGQVVSIGVDGLWRWGLNAKVEGGNSPLDRFWDQLILWLLAGRDFIPARQYSFRPSSANILLGEKVSFRLTLRNLEPKLKSVPVTLRAGETEVGRVTLVPSALDAGRLVGEFLPERTGRYQASVALPDGTRQDAHFIVYTENLEETEVATDTLYLRLLCESSGGRLIEPSELPKLLGELSQDKADLTPRTELHPIWNTAWMYYLAGALFGLDWFLRRRWGLC